MTTKSKLLLIFGGLFLSFFVFIIGSVFFTFFILPQMSAKKMVELNKRRSAETMGTFTSVSKHHSRVEKTGGGGTSYTYNYKYVVNDVPYRAEQSTSGGISIQEQKSGVQVKVCYDPADPKSSEFYDLKENKICGK